MIRAAIAAAASVAIALLSSAPAQADPGPGPGMCQYLGDSYNLWYPCTDPPAWIGYGAPDNPPYGSPLPASDCYGINAHNVGCS